MAFLNVVDLSCVEPVGRGTYRDVYIHPDDTNLVLKVLRHDSAITQGRWMRNFLKSRSLRQRYRFLYREYLCYFDLKIQQEAKGGVLPIAEIFGLQQTTKGLGMLSKRAVGKDKGPAMSLGRLQADDSVSADILLLLNKFISEIFRWGFVVNDTNPENVMLDFSEKIPRFILVDGFGDSNFIPISSWLDSQRINKLNRRFSDMAAFLGMTWDSDNRKILYA